MQISAVGLNRPYNFKGDDGKDYGQGDFDAAAERYAEAYDAFVDPDKKSPLGCVASVLLAFGLMYGAGKIVINKTEKLFPGIYNGIKKAGGAIVEKAIKPAAKKLSGFAFKGDGAMARIGNKVLNGLKEFGKGIAKKDPNEVLKASVAAAGGVVGTGVVANQDTNGDGKKDIFQRATSWLTNFFEKFRVLVKILS